MNYEIIFTEKIQVYEFNYELEKDYFFFILQMQENQNKAMLVPNFTLPDIVGMS